MTVTGGVEQVCASLANELCKENRVYVYSINHNNRAMPYKMDPRVKYQKGLQGETRLRHMIFKSFKPLIKFIKKNEIKIVMLMGNYPALITLPTKIFTKAKYIYCDHGALMNQWSQKDITLIRLFDAIFSDKVVTLTEQAKEDYHKKFLLPYNKLKCIYNWVDVQAEKASDYNVNSKRILSVGRFGREKGYELLVEVAEHVLKGHEEWSWDIYGEGEMFQEIKELIKSKGLERQIHLMGNVINMRERYKEYAFLVLTSYREGLPLVLLEAKANYLPLVSFDIQTGPNEIIRHQVDGVLIEPYKVEKMAESVEELMNSKELREKFSDASQENLNKFDKKNIVQEWRDLYQDLLDKNR